MKPNTQNRIIQGVHNNEKNDVSLKNIFKNMLIKLPIHFTCKTFVT